MGGRPATPLRLGRHEGGSDEQCPAPDQADGDVAFLATRIRCAVARRRVSPDVRRGSRRADVGTRVHTFDLHDDRPALSVRELVTDEDLAVLVLVGSIAVDPYRVVARLEPLVNAGGPDVLAHPHLRAGGGGVRRRRERDQAEGLAVAALMDSSRRAADMGVVRVVVMVYLAGVRQCGQRE